MFKTKVTIVTLIIMVSMTLSGCQTTKGLLDDTASISNYLSDKMEPIVDKQKAADAERKAKWLSIYMAQQNAVNRLSNYEVE